MHRRGQVLLIIVVFLGLISFLVLTFLDDVIANRRVGKRFQEDQEASGLAEAGLDKAIFELNQSGGSYTGEVDSPLGNGKFTVILTPGGNGNTKNIQATGTTARGTQETLKAQAAAIPSTTNISFSYATQTGQGGIVMRQNSRIGGTVYSNGDILCANRSAVITGDAYAAGNEKKIRSCLIDNDGHADKLLDCRIDHWAYYYSQNTCDVDEGNSSQGSQYIPSIQNFPISTQDITNWKNAAAQGNGGVPIQGPYQPKNNEQIGPVKINGNLKISNNSTVILAGTVWLTGNLTIGNGATLKLDDTTFGQNSGLVIADGQIDVGNGATIKGTSQSGSYLMLLSTSTNRRESSPAIAAGNNSQSAIYYASAGMIVLRNNSKLYQVTGEKLLLRNGVELQFESGVVVPVAFVDGPGGVWKLQSGTWQ